MISSGVVRLDWRLDLDLFLRVVEELEEPEIPPSLTPEFAFCVLVPLPPPFPAIGKGRISAGGGTGDTIPFFTPEGSGLGIVARLGLRLVEERAALHCLALDRKSGDPISHAGLL